MQELKQLVPRIEKIETQQEKLYLKFMEHVNHVRPDEIKLLMQKVTTHDLAIQTINSELGIAKKSWEKTDDRMTSFFNKVWDFIKEVITPTGLIYLILESKGIL